MAAPQVAAHALLWAGAGVEPVRMLNEMKAAGYAGVECNPIGSPERTKELFEERGLRLAASHIPLDRLEELLESHIHYLQAMGAQFLCVSGWNLEGAEAYRRAGRRLEEAGKRCADAGIRLCYHNHAFEIEGGLWGLRRLLEPTRPEHVHLCLDTYWIAAGGEDPLETLRAFRERTPYVHLKDIKKGEFKEIGQGDLDWRAIGAELGRWGLAWVTVEQDRTDSTPAESAAASRSFLRTTLGW